MSAAICGIDCAACWMKGRCAGCAAAGGRPFGGDCILAACCHAQGKASCGECGECSLKRRLIAEFNALHIPGMPEVTDLNALAGSYINLEYTFPGGERAKLWDDSRVYLGNQLCGENGRCFGLTADENWLLVCTYGAGGTDPEIAVFRRRTEEK